MKRKTSAELLDHPFLAHAHEYKATFATTLNKRTLGKYWLQTPLGEGAFGKAWLAADCEEGGLFCVKTFNVPPPVEVMRRITHKAR